MDLDIQFGEVEETPPQPELRPDRNKHYAVVACGAPVERELPIFVDLDVMRDMEAHAQTDTSVELGGVLLGGQFEDDEGRPFVVVTDSLRAEHYEATKGSFKFTHDTWAQISRQRDEFPADLQMVGWYHTHPDWGVFLSGMDMFICDNFFNKPLDVALVIDPCRGDRGWFQWTGDPRQRVRRTGGFYLIASRFRHTDLDLYAAQLEGKLAMPTDSRYSGIAPPPGYPAPVVNVLSDRGNSWQGVAMLGLLGVQFLFLALLAWKLLGPPASAPADDKQAAELAAVKESLDELRATHRAAARTDAQMAVIDRVVRELKQTPEDFVKSLERQQVENDELKGTVRGQFARERELEGENAKLKRTFEAAVAVAEQKQDRLDSEVSALNKTLKSLTAKYDKEKEKVASQDKELDGYREKKKEGEASLASWFSGWNLVWLGVSATVVLLLAAGGAAATYYRSPEEREKEAETPSEERPPPANK